MAQKATCNTKIQKSRGWTITINNYTEEDIKAIQALKCEHVFQEETGENGTPHIQGMLYFKNAVAFNTVKKALPTAHIEKMKNKIASIKYCSKEETRSGEIYSNINIEKEIGTVGTAHIEKKEILSPEKEVKNFMEQYQFWQNIKLNRKDLWTKYRKEIPEDIVELLEELDKVKLEPEKRDNRF